MTGPDDCGASNELFRSSVAVYLYLDVRNLITRLISLPVSSSRDAMVNNWLDGSELSSLKDRTSPISSAALFVLLILH